MPQIVRYPGTCTNQMHKLDLKAAEN
eukprot:SAG11_NODE_34850_length_269_cov_2.435294_1_plen_25_part_10